MSYTVSEIQSLEDDMKPSPLGSLLALLLAAASLTACGDDPAAPAASSGGDTETSSEAPEECAALQEEYPGLKGEEYDVGVSPGIGNYNNPNLEDPSKPDGLEPEVLRAAGECLGFTGHLQAAGRSTPSSRP
jgi:polar amino acid transport system substrate-binding protein